MLIGKTINTKLDSCPKCKGNFVGIFFGYYRGGIGYFAGCYDGGCMYRTPYRRIEEKAIAVWNSKHRD
jgi:hypothetical protein